MRIVIRGKEITNPIAKLGIGFLGFLLSVVMAAVVLFVILPLMGIILAVTMGVFLAIAVSILIVMITFVIILRRHAERDRLSDNERHSDEVK